MARDTVSISKNSKTSAPRAFIGLAACLLVAAAAFILDGLGIGLFDISNKLVEKTLENGTVENVRQIYTMMYFLGVIALCLGMYYVILLLSMAKIRRRSGTKGEVRMLRGLYRLLCGMAIFVGLFYVLGMLGAFGAFFSMFGGMLLGWSLQAPVSGFAAWIMVTVIRPYKIGDRISLPNYGLMGDVVKFNAMYLTLNQVGGTVGSEEPIGRMICVPNAVLFGAMIINCTYQQKQEEAAYVLDETVFRVTLDSDWDTVEDILLTTAREVTRDIIAATKTEPYIRAETWDYGTLFRLRYMSDSVDRPRIMYEIVKAATKKIQSNRNVDLAIPFVYSFKRGVETADKGKSADNVENIDIDKIDCPAAYDAAFYDDNRAEILSLIEKIKQEGLLQPVMVARNLSGDGRYTLLYGEKRLKACIVLGWKKIPAEIKNKFGTDIKSVNKALSGGDVGKKLEVDQKELATVEK